MGLALEQVLAFRLAGERARMDDLRSLALRATPHESDQQRRTSLTDRIDRRLARTAALRDAATGWEEWQTDATAADDLVDEVVALLLTQMLRSEGLADGTFDAAEALIAELTGAAGVDRLVLAHTQELESINHARSSVSLRFPGSRIWELPFLGHELGHHLVEHLRHLEPGLADRRPLREVTMFTAATMEAADQTPTQARSHADELMADALATICCGPTYPLACLVLRVPGGVQASRPSASHPAWRDRVATMCETLDALSDVTGQARYRQQRADMIDPLALRVLGAVPAVSAGGEIAARGAAREVRAHRNGLVYTEADRAILVSELLATGQGSPPPGTSVRAVLDGAWRWRLAQPEADDADAVSRATRWCRPAPASPGGSQ